MTDVKPPAPALASGEDYVPSWFDYSIGSREDQKVGLGCWDGAAILSVGPGWTREQADAQVLLAISYDDVTDLHAAALDLLLIDFAAGLSTTDEDEDGQDHAIRMVELAGGGQLRMELVINRWTENEYEEDEETGENVLIDTYEASEAEAVRWKLTVKRGTDLEREDTVETDLDEARKFTLVLAGITAARARRLANGAA